MQSPTVAVPIGPCSCPGTPHEHDSVDLRSKLGLAAGTMLQRLIVEANQSRPDAAELTGQLSEAYLRVGVVGWSFVDEKGKPVPVTPATLREYLLDDFERAIAVADAADDLYKVPVLGPLVLRAANSSPTTTTSESTSPTPRGGTPKRPRRSKPSSTSTTATGVTAMTSV
jgi:hypothetical protein